MSRGQLLIGGIVLLIVIGCSGRDSSRKKGRPVLTDGSMADAGTRDAAAQTTMLEGTYEIQAWTRNSTGCTTGSSVIASETDRFAFVRHQIIFGDSLLTTGTCAIKFDCDEEAAVPDNDLRLTSWAFDRGSDSTGWRGETSSTTQVSDADCNAVVYKNSLTSVGASIIMRQELHELSYPPSDDIEDPCPTDLALAATSSVTCVSLEEIAAGAIP